MAKIILIVVILIVLRLLMWIGFKIVKIMASSNKEDKNEAKISNEQSNKELQEYVPINQDEPNKAVESSNNNHFSVDDFKISDTGFTDHADDEFFDYSAHMRNRKGREVPLDFDTKGDFADNFEYEPSSPELDFLHKHQPKPKPKNLPQTLNELPDEIKALMISGLFDPKFK